MSAVSTVRRWALISAAALIALAAPPAWSAVDLTGAKAIFDDAAAICTREGGATWGRTLCGPILVVDPTDRSIIANQADAGGVLEPSGGFFVGTLPASEMLANTPVTWSGTLWTQLLWPITDEPAKRQVMIAHELFHRVQIEQKMVRSEGDNRHLDSLEGRYLLQLEWRALAAAMKAKTAAARRAAAIDALAFRQARYRLFPEAEAAEAPLEINEGVPEYTGVMAGLATHEERVAFAVHDLSAFADAPTFVRTFPYASGAAYGLLLDEAAPGWRGQLGDGLSFGQRLGAALKLPQVIPGDLAVRTAAYDDGTLRTAEVKRDQDRQAYLAQLKARLVDGPVLSLPLLRIGYQFNPQTLQPLGELGTVYPTLRLTSDWGVLTVEKGALLNNRTKVGTVSAAGMDSSGLKGDGWTLSLKPGWVVAPGERKGDFAVKPGPVAP